MEDTVGTGELGRILAEQHGVVSRVQALEAGLTGDQLTRRLQRGDWWTVHPGVFAVHRGPWAWPELAWAGVLALWPAALTHESALRSGEGPGRRGRDTSVVHVAVDRGRRLAGPVPEGVRVHRTGRLEERVRWDLGPPRLGHEDAVLEVAAAAGGAGHAVSVLAAAGGGRRAAAIRFLEALQDEPWAPRRGWLEGVLLDVVDGICSVLEQGFLDLVEVPHGLPHGRRRVAPVSSGWAMRREVSYDGVADGGGLPVELDGRVRVDPSGPRAVPATPRLGYAEVFDRPCSTATELGRALQLQGWAGVVRPCEQCGDLDQAS